jgi:L-ascorbate metabolism protein UlaG (beta-lactamase superfamily)
MGPDEAVQVFRDLGSRWLVPMHFGSFRLSFEDMDAPPQWLTEIAVRDGLMHQLKIMEEGVPLVF